MFCSGINITAVNYSWEKSLVSKFGEILPSGSGKTSYRFGEILVSFCILQRAATLHWLGVARPHVLLLTVGPSWASACILILF